MVSIRSASSSLKLRLTQRLRSLCAEILHPSSSKATVTPAPCVAAGCSGTPSTSGESRAGFDVNNQGQNAVEDDGWEGEIGHTEPSQAASRKRPYQATQTSSAVDVGELTTQGKLI